jgi:hypothetical protein
MLYTFEKTEIQVIDSDQFHQCANLEEATELVRLGYGSLISNYEIKLLSMTEASN